MKKGRPAQCQYIKANGKRCEANAMIGSEYCFFHDPAKAKERTAARKAGGHKNKAVVLPATTPDVRLDNISDVVKLLGETINQVRGGELDPKVSNAIGYLTGILLKALEQGEIEERLSALETIVKGQPKNPELLFDDDRDDQSFVFEQATLAPGKALI